MMWIRSPFKVLAINSDQVKIIFIDRIGTSIKAKLSEEETIVLGEYKDRETCLMVLNELLESMKMMCTIYDMPKQEEIDDGYFKSNCQT